MFQLPIHTTLVEVAEHVTRNPQKASNKEAHMRTIASSKSPSHRLKCPRAGTSVTSVVLAFVSTGLAATAAHRQEPGTIAPESESTTAVSTIRLQGHAGVGEIDQEKLFSSLILSDPQLPLIVKESLPALLNVCKDRQRQSAWYYLKNNSFLWVDSSTLQKIENCAAACNMPLTCL